MKNIVFSIFLTGILSDCLSQTANWTPLLPNKFPSNMVGQIHGQCRITQMKFHSSNPAKMYAVTSQGGLFMSTDTGNNWTVSGATDFIASQFASVAVDPTNDQIIYLGAGDPNYYSNGTGVWKSTNGGTNFTQSNTGMGNRLVVEILIDPTNTSVLVAATNNGIYKSTNGGSSWSLQSTVRQFTDLKQKPVPGSKVLYAATRDSAFFKSTDFGTSWTQISSGLTMPTGITNGNGCRIAVTPADTNAVYFGMVVAGGLVYKSINEGNSFRRINIQGSPYLTNYSSDNSQPGQGNYNFTICVDYYDTSKIWVQAHNTWYSSNGGASWTQLTFWAYKCHTDMHELKQSPYNPTHLYSMNDGGVWRSVDAGNNWTPKSDGLFAFEVTYRDGKTSPTRRDFINIGTQDNGELFADSTGWFCIRGGDWYEMSAMDYRPNNEGVYYIERNTRRMTKSGGTATYNLPHSVAQTLAFHRSTPATGFRADTIVYRTYNVQSSTPTWTNIYTIPTPRAADAHVAFADTNTLYIITDNGKVLVSNNIHAASPSFNTYNLPSNSNSRAFITSIANNSNIVYVVANNKVYRSINGGSTWTDISYNLPNQNHNRILSEEFYGQEELVLVATGSAVYYKKGTLTAWTLYTTNMQTRKSIEDFCMYDDGTRRSILRQSSYGRGTWETPFHNLRPLKAIFNSDKKLVCNGQSIQFIDSSLGNITSYYWQFPGGNPGSSTSPGPTVTYSGLGKYNVTLIVSDGTKFDTLTKTNYITDSSLIAPIDISTSANKNICLGSTTTLAVSGLGKIGWYNAPSGGTYLKGGSAYTTPALNTNTVYYVQDSNFCGASPRTAISVNVYPAPNAPANTTPASNLSICANTNTTLTASGIGQLGWYSASVGGSYLGGGTSYSTPNITSNTTYYVQDSNPCAISGRTAITVSITATQAPPTNTTPNTNLNICSGSTTNLSASGSADGQRQWYASASGGTRLGVGNAYTTGVLTANTNFYVQDSSSCGISTRTLITVNVYPVLSPPNNTTPTADLNKCINQTTTLTASGVGTLGWYNASSGGTYLAGGNNFNITNLTATATYYVQDSNGCGATPRTAITVTVSSPPSAPTNTTSPANLTICEGTSTSLQVSGGTNLGWYDTWTGGVKLGSGNPLATGILTMSKTFYVQDSNSCGSGPRTAITVNIILKPPMPNSNTPSSSLTICAGGSTSLSVSGSGKFSWYTSAIGGTYLGSGNLYNTPKLSVTTDFYVQDSGTCGGSNRRLITVHVLPAKTYSQTISICNGGQYDIGGHSYTKAGNYRDTLVASNSCDSIVKTSIILIASNTVKILDTGAVLTASIQGDKYNWIDCSTGDTIPGAIGQKYTVTKSGAYAVRVKKGSCLLSSPCGYFILNASLYSAIGSNSILLYPNPAKDYVEIESTLPIEELILQDIFGKNLEVYYPRARHARMDTKFLSKGIYIIKLTDIYKHCKVLKLEIL